MKKLMSVLLALVLVLAMVPVAASAEGTGTLEDPVTTADQLTTALGSAQAGDTIHISGEIELDATLNITKPVNLEGVNENATLIGSVMYQNFSGEAQENKTISWKNITLKAPEGNNHQGLCISTGVSGYTITIESSAFEGWEYAIGANSGASTNTLSVTATTFTDTFCAVSAKIGNTVNFGDSVTTDETGYAVQVFGTKGEETFDGYYETVENYTSDTEQSNPDVGGVMDGGAYVATPSTLSRQIEAADDGATVYLAAGTYNLTDTLSITKRVNLVGAGTDKTTIVGPVQYMFSTDQHEETLSISGITFQARENEASVQGLQFRAIGPNGGYNLNITVENSAFEGWDFGITMNSHANGYDLTVADCFFANGLYAVSYNNDTTTEGQKANNTLTFGETNTLEDVTFAVQEFNNAPVGTEGVVDNTYATAGDFTAGTPYL